MMPILWIVGILMLGWIAYMVYCAHDDHIQCDQITCSRLPNEFNSFHILLIADIHRRKLNPKTFEKWSQVPDIVCIAGDLMERGVPYGKMRSNIRVLKQWKTPVFFVWGNNDYETQPNEMIRILKQEGVIILEDEIHTLHRNQAQIKVVGFDFYFDYFDDSSQIDWSVIKDSFTILLTHNPKTYDMLENKEKAKIDLVLAGHTHGGQIRIFGIGPYTKGGLSYCNHTNMVITEGYGYSLLPFRFGTKAECHFLTLQTSKS